MMKIRILQYMICLGVLLVLGCAARAEKWIYYDTALTGDMYYDKSSIKKADNGVTSVRTKNILNEDGQTKYHAILKILNKAPANPASLHYSITLMELNYASKEIRDVSLSFYDEKNQTVYTSPRNDVGAWNAVQSGTIGEKLFNLISWEADMSTRHVDASKIQKAPLPEKPAVAPADVAGKNDVPPGGTRHQPIQLPQKAIRQLVDRWLASWQSGDMETYRSCYASDFEAKGMNLDEWITYKTNVALKSEKIEIRIDALRISVNGKEARAQFRQHYRSSRLKNSVRKILEFRKIDSEWKIYREYV